MFREMHSDSLYKHFHAGYFQHPHLGLTGDDHIVGAAGRPYLPGHIHLASSAEVVDLLCHHGGLADDPVGVGGGVAGL